MSKIVDAVTVVMICRGRLLMVLRQGFLAAFPGYQAFPGGKVDAEDSEGATPPAHWGEHEPRLLRALIRELREELDLDLLALAAKTHIRALGVALTPPHQPRRFNTYFFQVELDEEPVLKVDAHELQAAAWRTPQEWLELRERGEALLAVPTVAVVQALAQNLKPENVPGLDFRDRPPQELPMLDNVPGLRIMPVRSNTLPPAEHTNCFLLGDAQSHRVLVDPSPGDAAEFEKLCAMVERHGIHEVFLTHHHPDHHERSADLARRFAVPIGMSEDTQQRIQARCGQDYFANLAVHHYREGDVLCRWRGEAVRVLAVPGHDEGQLALMPDNRAWCIVGDLIQGIGTVVISKPEGDMAKYYASLQRLIDLDPKIIVPSHGIAMGSTYRLRDTLHHRQLREQQVLSLWNAGHEIDAMLPLIYKDVDPRLLPLARRNIESHLHKLREEGVLARS